MAMTLTYSPVSGREHGREVITDGTESDPIFASPGRPLAVSIDAGDVSFATLQFSNSAPALIDAGTGKWSSKTYDEPTAFLLATAVKIIATGGDVEWEVTR